MPSSLHIPPYLSSLTSCISIKEVKALGTIPLNPPSPSGRTAEIPPSLEGGRGDVSTESPLSIFST